ncbi:unnamed protein product [Larinioides sclopetarius]|uniref:Uncharacterized protein n=1 Tax=Larinioides sclopetarius TaxID=280406 RepID=A0AAV2BB20_9ARAC
MKQSIAMEYCYKTTSFELPTSSTPPTNKLESRRKNRPKGYTKRRPISDRYIHL